MKTQRKAQLWEAIHQELIRQKATNGEIIQLFGKSIFWRMHFSNYTKITNLRNQEVKPCPK